MVVRPLGLREVTGSSPVFSTMGFWPHPLVSFVQAPETGGYFS